MKTPRQRPFRWGIAALMLLALAPAGLARTAGAAQGFPSFVDVALEVGITLLNICGLDTKEYIVEVNGNGAGFFDYDDDGDIDLIIANGSTLEGYRDGGDPLAALYENREGRFEDVTAGAGLDAARGWGAGVCVADYDNDGHQDLYLTGYGPNALYRNKGDRTFENVTSAAGAGDARWSTGCAFGDYDRDGDVDLYVANYVVFDFDATPRRGETDLCRYMGVDVFCGPRGFEGDSDSLFRNDGDGTFTDVSMEAGIAAYRYNGFGVVFGDFDDDGWPDIYVANDFTPNLLFRNNRDGTFSEIGLLSGTALNDEGREQAGMGVGVGDYDRNGLVDIFVTNFAQDTNTLYRNDGDAFFTDATLGAGLGRLSFGYLGWGTGFADLDNDGWEDIFVANGHVYPEVDGLELGTTYRQRKEVYRNRGDGTFEEVAGNLGGDLLAARSARGTAFGDYDNDGDVDIFVVNMNERPSLYRNDGGNDNGWITLRLEGTESNRDAIGARVEVRTGEGVQVAEVRSGGSYLSHSDMRLHFGLGPADRVERIEIRWPSGRVEVWNDLSAGRFVTIKEGEGQPAAGLIPSRQARAAAP